MAIISAVGYGASDVCSNLNVINKTLQCYQCKSHLSEREPQCDNNLWQHLRHSEKFKLRTRCHPSKSKNYCIKRVRRKLGERITERGCFNPDAVSSTRRNNKTVKISECNTFSEGEYLTTLCICSESLCNGASQSNYPGKVTKLFGLAIIFCICLYLLLRSFISVFY